MKDCRDCKYCIEVSSIYGLDTCNHPLAVFTYCDFEREDLGSVCKEEGILFEKKDD